MRVGGATRYPHSPLALRTIRRYRQLEKEVRGYAGERYDLSRPDRKSCQDANGKIRRVSPHSRYQQSLLKFRSIEFLAEALNLWRTTMVPNTSAVTSRRTEVGRQFTLNTGVKSVAPNSGGYRRAPQTQAVAARSPQSTAWSSTQGSSSTNTPVRKGDAWVQNANNKVTLTGHLSRDGAVRQTTNGHVVANFSIGVDESYKDRLGEWQKKVSWHRVQVWGELAETVGPDLKQGVRVYVEGRLVNHAWVDPGNRKHRYTGVVAKDVRFLDAAPRPETRNGGEFTQEYSADLQ
jgi:single stranded DNA-binding protein